jgi:hypothetical protein
MSGTKDTQPIQKNALEAKINSQLPVSLHEHHKYAKSTRRWKS